MTLTASPRENARGRSGTQRTMQGADQENDALAQATKDFSAH